ncbi:MAG: efflux RND transporter periplasmic adaptor subunit [candidate division Zixibacteria bacterium]|nr:efflux RND transporter periplasmic adaptor subunit [candidate division Zixibacteria bacterium]
MTEEHNVHNFNDPNAMPEGEEAPPPGTKTMSIVRWGLLGAMTLFAIVMVLTAFDLAPWQTTVDAKIQYHCPMHPTYVSNQPGDCPICGMSLVPIGGKDHIMADTPSENMTSTSDTSVYYTCPMHPEVVSDTMGKCPKCGMNLEPAMKATNSSAKFYCPMHPEVVSDSAGECPKCGMDLIPRDAEEHEMHGDMDMNVGNVPGLVSVTIEPQRLQLINVKTETVKHESLSEDIETVGYIVADEAKTASVSIRTNGFVQKLFINETGQRIERGEPLLSLYSPELFQAQQEFLLAAQSAAQSIGDSTLKRTRTELLLSSRHRLGLLGLSEKEIEEIIKSGKTNPELLLRSPISGIVLEKMVNVGQSITSDQALYTVADLSIVWVLADIYETDLTKVSSGQSAEITLGRSANPIQGKVQFIYPTLNESTRTAKARIPLSNPEGHFKPGMFVTVRFKQTAADALTISPDAIVDEGSRQYVFVVHNTSHFEPRLITTGSRTDDRIEILSGLREGEIVVNSANFLIDSESRLKAALAGMTSIQSDPHAGHGGMKE